MFRLRLIPIVLFATISLLVLKAGGLLGGGGYTLAGLADARAQSAAVAPPQPLDAGASAVPTVPATPARAAPKQRSWAQESFGFPDITGAVGGGQNTPPPPPDAKPPPEPPKGTPVSLDDRPQMSAGERAVLERLQERRQELENRARELEIREGLLKAAEKRLEARLGELKQLEAQVTAATQKKDEAEAARFKGLVTMYENMKAKEAARIFDRLDLRVLLDVAGQINPRRMSEILAQMSPEAAERLTVELAARAANNGSRPPSPAELPKIEGRPRN